MGTNFILIAIFVIAIGGIFMKRRNKGEIKEKLDPPAA